MSFYSGHWEILAEAGQVISSYLDDCGDENFDKDIKSDHIWRVGILPKPT